jgi:hypothetical protein
MNPEAILQQRYPQYDFALYFDLLKHFRRTPKRGKTQRHHICPRAQFPEFECFDQFPENRVALTPREHGLAHLLLESLSCGTIWKTPPAWIAAAVEGGRITGRKMRDNRRGIHAPEHLGKGGRIGGRISGRQHKENGTGWFAPGNAAKGGRITGRVYGPISCHIRWHVKRGIVNPKCSLCKPQ